MMGSRKMIGEIMVSLGYVSIEHINEARRHQMQGAGKRIGECLVELGYIQEEEVKRALTVQGHG
ncbi:MAG: hypothetical protein KJ620_07785 [Candidatus Edwardsbacteria bacterium]|nr:hypothetical protein [Candidatus Edwardsbacteria bacterium]MBU1576876.1 hypothetical protein [Candidatus Edwardsbacteria bacterium]MBU2463157.1 hypothetical protein [Candidatus Edwardsbacteria bacterium]MBU2593456.1 hypothetical protein [Candidatus Edwardsbacteria bacterium]